MDAPGRLVYVRQIAVDVGAFELAPFAIFLYQLEQMDKLRALLFAIFRKQYHCRIVRRLLMLVRRFEHRQAEVVEQVLFERIGGCVCAHVYAAGHRVDFSSERHELCVCFLLPFQHYRRIHRHTVVLHHAAIYCGRRFDALHDIPMLRQILRKPAVELVIEPQRIIAVGAGIAQRLMLGGVHLIEMPSSSDRIKIRHLRAEKRGGKQLQAAVMKVAKLKLALESKLGCCNGVVAGFAYDDAQRIQEHRLKGEIVRHLDHIGVFKEHFT